jgi:hypothetical protein
VKPVIERRGVSFSRILQDGGTGPKLITKGPTTIPTPDVDIRFTPFPTSTPSSYASDHCPVFLKIP